MWRNPCPYNIHMFTCAMRTYMSHFTDGAFSSAVGAFHPDHRAERPFPEEDPGAEGDGFLKPGLPPPSQLEGLKHFLQQVREVPLIPPFFLLLSSSFLFSTLGVQGWLHLPFWVNTSSQLLTQSYSCLINPFWNLVANCSSSPASASLRYPPSLFLYWS